MTGWQLWFPGQRHRERSVAKEGIQGGHGDVRRGGFAHELEGGSRRAGRELRDQPPEEISQVQAKSRRGLHRVNVVELRVCPEKVAHRGNPVADGINLSGSWSSLGGPQFKVILGGRLVGGDQSYRIGGEQLENVAEGKASVRVQLPRLQGSGPRVVSETQRN